MRKTITCIIITLITMLCLVKCSYAAGQLQATIQITPSVTQVVAGDKVTFSFVTKNIVNAEFEKIYAIEGVIQYDENFFQLEAGGMEVGDTGRFISMTPVGEGGTNGTITLKVVDNPTGSGVVKFTELAAGDGRIEDSETLGIATTQDTQFTITIKQPASDDEQDPPTGGDDDKQDPPAGGDDDKQDPPTGGDDDKQDPPTGGDDDKQDPPAGGDDDKQDPPAGGDDNKQDPPTGGDDDKKDPQTGGNNNQQNPPKKDPTATDKDYVHAGLGSVLLTAIGVIAILAIIMYKKTQKYGGIK